MSTPNGTPDTRPDLPRLTQRLLTAMLLMLLLIAALGGIALYAIERHEVTEALHEAHAHQHSLLHATLAPIADDEPEVLLRNRVETIVPALDDLVALRLLRDDGRLRLDWSRPGTVPGEHGHTDVEPLVFLDGTRGTLEVTWDTDWIPAEVFEHVVISWLFFACGSLLLAASLWLLFRHHVLLPLAATIHRLDAIARRETPAPMAPAVSDEFARLDATTARLAEVVTEERDALERIERVNTELAELRQRNELILNTAGEGIFGLDLDGRVTFANQEAQRLLGWSLDELAGVEIERLLGNPEQPEGASAARSPIRTCLEEGTVQRVDEAEFWRWNRTRFPVEYTSTPMIERGEARGAVVVFRSTIERRHTEQELRLAASTFDSREAILITDPSGTILRVNHAFTQMTGYSPVEAVGRNAGFQKSGRHDDAFYRAMWQALQERGHWEGEIWNLRRSGEEYPLWYSISAVRDEHGVPSHYVAHASDISKMRQTEDELREAVASAEAAGRVKAEFLATMSHEIRTPLNAVLGLLGLMQDEGLDPRMRTYVKTARDSGEALLELVSDILDYTKMDAGKLELETAPFDPERMVNGVGDLLGPKATEKGLAWEVTVDGPMPRALLGDPGRLRQVLLNLAANAIKYTEQGRVAVHLCCTPRGEGRWRLCVQVDDTGIGIPVEHQARLFQEFSMVDASYARRFGGTGLGLAISRRLVELMGGHMEFHSAEGRGSRFWFELDLDEGEPGEAESGAASDLQALAALPARSARILLADDVAANRLVAKEMLERAGHRVDMVADGFEVLQAVTAYPYDLVLMDISMPGMDGIAATHRIRALPGSLGRIPIVAMTAHAMRGDREAFIEAGMDDYLAKPLVRERLLQTVAQWTGHTWDEVERPHEDSHEGSGATVAEDAPGSGPVPAARPPSDGHVDAATLEQLGRDTDPVLVPELVVLFVDDARGRVARIEAALAAGDLVRVEDEAHALGSSAATYGLPRLHAVARRCEAALREGDHARGTAEARELVAMAAAAFAALEAHVAAPEVGAGA